MARRYLNEFDSGAHSKYLMYGHLVIVTKYRRPMLYDESVRTRVIGLFRVLGKKYDVIVEQAKGEEDHIHFLLRYKPTTNIPKYIGVCKSMSSRILKEEFPEIEGYSRKGALWSASYCLLSTGGAPIDIIRQYIENQGKNGR